MAEAKPRGPKVARASDELLDELKAWLEKPVPNTPLRRYDLYDWGAIQKAAGLKIVVSRWFKGQVRDDGTPFRMTLVDALKLADYLTPQAFLPNLLNLERGRAEKAKAGHPQNLS